MYMSKPVLVRMLLFLLGVVVVGAYGNARWTR